jgi:hypothetical protein
LPGNKRKGAVDQPDFRAITPLTAGIDAFPADR